VISTEELIYQWLSIAKETKPNLLGLARTGGFPAARKFDRGGKTKASIY
jgi:hypothetical protein